MRTATEIKSFKRISLDVCGTSALLYAAAFSPCRLQFSRLLFAPSLAGKGFFKYYRAIDPLAQLDRAAASYAAGSAFESHMGHLRPQRTEGCRFNGVPVARDFAVRQNLAGNGI